MTALQIRTIHVACRDLQIDEDSRRALQLRLIGKASLSQMTEAELGRVIDALKQQGFTPSGGTRAKRQTASRGDLRFCHVLWGKLVKAGAVASPGAKGLNAFIRTRFEKAWGSVPIDIDQMRDAGQIATVIEALKAMCRRAGVKL